MHDERDVIVNLDDLKEVTPTPSLNLPDIEEEAAYRPKDGSPYLVFTCKPAGRHLNKCPDCGYPFHYDHLGIPRRCIRRRGYHRYPQYS